MIEYRDNIKRADLKNEKDKLFVFGDNIVRKGLGGQAAVMRDEPNAVGIPTKLYPTMKPSAFFTNYDIEPFMRNASSDFSKLVHFKGTIVWPSAGIGTGRAQLKQRAPLIWNIIEALRRELEKGS